MPVHAQHLLTNASQTLQLPHVRKNTREVSPETSGQEGLSAPLLQTPLDKPQSLRREMLLSGVLEDKPTERMLAGKSERTSSGRAHCCCRYQLLYSLHVDKREAR